MRIGVDARELAGRPTGVGRYLAELLAAWAAQGAAGRHQFLLYGPAPLPDAASARIDALGAAVRLVPGAGGTTWEQTRLAPAARADRLDVFFAPAYTAPLRMSCPVVLTIHDVSFCAHPEWFPAREGLRRRLLTRWSARRASVVLTDTEFSRKEIETYLGLPPSRLRVIPLGAGIPAFMPRASSSAAAGVPASREPLVLFVGSLFNRRRVQDLIGAFPLVLRVVPDARLDIVGENRTYPPQDLARLCDAAGVGDRIRLRSYVPDDELADAYARASAFAFLSEYEGFGLPPLEALASGIPVVLLDTPVAREVCGAAACYVAPGDVAAVADAIASLLSSPTRREAVLREAAPVLARYSWPDAARKTLDAIESAVR